MPHSRRATGVPGTEPDAPERRADSRIRRGSTLWARPGTAETRVPGPIIPDGGANRAPGLGCRGHTASRIRGVTSTAWLDLCPSCAEPLNAPLHGAPWCPRCEWGLGELGKPPRRGDAGRRQRLSERLDLAGRRTAYALNGRAWRELGSLADRKAPLTAGGVALIVVSAMLLAGAGILIGLGLVLVARFPSPVFILGVLLVLVGVELRPRVPRMRLGYVELQRADAPGLFHIVDRAASAIGSRPIDSLGIDPSYNAMCGRSGLRRRRVLELGLPLWAALSGDGRLALLGHELGHLVNGDPGQALLTQPAMATFGRLAILTDPSRPVRRHGFDATAEKVSRIVLAPLFAVCAIAHYLLTWCALRQAQRAERAADQRAIDLGGTAGARDLTNALLFGDVISTRIRRLSSRTADPAQWRLAAQEEIERSIASRAIMEQQSIRDDASLWQAHPPAGWRSRAVTAAPAAAARLQVDIDAWAVADRELASMFERVSRTLRST
jgi:heat shock protein HtpX